MQLIEGGVVIKTGGKFENATQIIPAFWASKETILSFITCKLLLASNWQN